MTIPDRVRRAGDRLDRQTRGFLRDSTKLGAGSIVVVVGYAAQIALITHLLGLDDYGVFVIVVATVDLVARFLDLQVGPMTTAFAASSIRSDPGRTIGVAQFGYLVDIGSGVAGFLVVLAIAPFAAAHLLDGESWLLFPLYGLTILVTTTETISIALLQLMGRFGRILRLTILREIIRVTLVAAAAGVFRSVEAVIVALLAMETILAVFWLLSADASLRRFAGGAGLLRPSLAHTRGLRREMARMVVHTNLISYVKILAAQGPTLLLGTMRPPIDAGLFKIGTSIAVIAGKPADPAWAAVLPRFARLRAAGRIVEMRSLIRQATLGAFLLLSIIAVLTILLRDPLLRLFGGEAALAAGAVLVLSVLARVVNGTVFWNAPLLYAFKQAHRASSVYVGASAVFVPVLVLSIDRWGADGAAAALLLWSILVNAGLTASAVRTLRAPPADADAALSSVP